MMSHLRIQSHHLLMRALSDVQVEEIKQQYEQNLAREQAEAQRLRAQMGEVAARELQERQQSEEASKQAVAARAELRDLEQRHTEEKAALQDALERIQKEAEVHARRKSVEAQGLRQQLEHLQANAEEREKEHEMQAARVRQQEFEGEKLRQEAEERAKRRSLEAQGLRQQLERLKQHEDAHVESHEAEVAGGDSLPPVPPPPYRASFFSKGGRLPGLESTFDEGNGSGKLPGLEEHPDIADNALPTTQTQQEKLNLARKASLTALLSLAEDDAPAEVTQPGPLQLPTPVASGPSVLPPPPLWAKEPEVTLEPEGRRFSSAQSSAVGDTTPRLFHISKDDTSMEVVEVPLTRASLNDGDCFILHAGAKIYKWFGTSSSPFEKNRCNMHAETIEAQSHGKATALAYEDEEEAFWALLGGAGPIAGGAPMPLNESPSAEASASPGADTKVSPQGLRSMCISRPATTTAHAANRGTVAEASPSISADDASTKIAAGMRGLHVRSELKKGNTEQFVDPDHAVKVAAKRGNVGPEGSSAPETSAEASTFGGNRFAPTQEDSWGPPRKSSAPKPPASQGPPPSAAPPASQGPPPPMPVAAAASSGDDVPEWKKEVVARRLSRTQSKSDVGSTAGDVPRFGTANAGALLIHLKGLSLLRCFCPPCCFRFA
jgi:hypothetical protein